ncbi:ThuA domain-containing protein [Martelella sp. HB161492]|uniref:ThuA domain-containing protein n=1 Tax=Martelella sp. HB161492 TaxID=2720726 RepID=UPI001591C531|nr:ThuA domain-containing protein [Martelella sp. HB161492]
MARRAQIIWGGWPGHEPKACARLIAGMLEDDGFAVSLSGDLSLISAGETLAADLLVLIVTGEALGDIEARALTEAVRGGLGVAGFHAGLAASFKASAAFRYLAGVTFAGHPGGIIDYHVDITRPDDPVMAGIEGFGYRSEQYYLHYDPSVDVLATTRFSGAHDAATEGVVMPVVIKRRFGAGRIFYSALGHSPSELAHPQAQLILRRGFAWAAR